MTAAPPEDRGPHCPGCGRTGCPGCLPALDPPRYCDRCGRRMRVAVTPAGYRATCREHGQRAAQPPR